jgi:WD40 repeat protein
MLLPSGNLNAQITKQDLKLKSNIDIQGLDWKNKNREAHFNRHIDHLEPTFNVINAKKAHPQNFIETKRPILKFSKFVPDSSLYLSHFQIYQNCRSISDNDVLFISYFGVSSMNLCSLKSKNIIKLSVPESLSYSRSLNMTAGIHSTKKIFLYDLSQSKMVMNIMPFDPVVSVTNKALIMEEQNPKLVVGGNAPFALMFDIETQTQTSKVKSIAFINDIDFSPQYNMLAFAMDNKTIQVKDPRDNDTLGVLLKGHEDYNFCVRFLSDYQLASGGQDVTTRIWDIRKTGKELVLLEGYTTGISALEYSKSNNLLFCIENFGYLYCYDLTQSVIQRDTANFFGFSSGIALSPSGNSIFTTVSKIKSGILKFEICDNYSND